MCDKNAKTVSDVYRYSALLKAFGPKLGKRRRWLVTGAAGIRRLIASTYQAVSGAGKAGLEELQDQTRAWVRGEESKVSAFAYPIAFNLILHIDAFTENGYTKEELKMRNESRKILHAPELRVSCTCVRVPVLRSHSEALTIETERPLTPDEARELLRNALGGREIGRASCRERV